VNAPLCRVPRNAPRRPLKAPTSSDPHLRHRSETTSRSACPSAFPPCACPTSTTPDATRTINHPARSSHRRPSLRTSRGARCAGLRRAAARWGRRCTARARRGGAAACRTEPSAPAHLAAHAPPRGVGRVVDAVVELVRVRDEVVEGVAAVVTVGEQLVRRGAGHGHRPAVSVLGEHARPIRGGVGQVHTRQRLGGLDAGRGEDGRRHVHQRDQRRVPHAAPRPTGRLHHQRDLDQRVVHRAVLEQQVVEAQVLAVVGREHDERVVVAPALPEPVQQEPDPVIQLGDGGVVVGHHGPQRRSRSGRPVERQSSRSSIVIGMCRMRMPVAL
jgi:hypothetical protein